MRKVIATILLLALMSTPALADTKYVNSTDGLRVRTAPGTDAEIITVLPFGSAVELADDGEYGDWYLIWNGDETAYISSEFVQETDPLEELTYMGDWRITAYAYTGSACANGNYPQVDYTIACNSLPFGSVVYIKGVGFRTVEDRGPTWLGDEWCDLYLGNESECIQWGNQYHDVYLVEERG